MNIIRLGDRIESSQRPAPLGKSYAVAEYLAQKVFNPSPDRKDIEDYYIQSQPLADRPPFMELFPQRTPSLGEHEVKLIGKLLEPQRPVLVIVGPLGSGKTTLKNYIALNLIQNRKHCEKCRPPRERLIAHIDFNEHTNLNSVPEHELNTEVYKILCNELKSRLNLARPLSENDEFDDFWKQQIEEYKEQKSSSMAFRNIISLAQNPEKLFDFTQKNEQLNNERKLLLANFFIYPEIYLDYLIRLWRFIIQYHYCGSFGCGFVLLDNLDRVYPTVQRKVIEAVHTHARMGGPTFMILVRPETFDIVGLGTGIIDVENQNGPKPFDVISQHLNKFCADPEKYYSPDAGLPHQQFEILIKYLESVKRAIYTDPHQVFSKFMDNVCGKSIRIGHLIAQSFFYASRAEMMNDSVNVHDLIRLCIRGDSPQLIWKPNGVIEHLFRVSTQTTSGLLIKPRILRYLGRSERTRRKFGEIHNVITGFGYDNSIITDAINDLMNTNHQLIRSNGFDYYGNRALQISGGDNLRLTETGKGYSDYLLSDLDYIQEVMLDTYVDAFGDHLVALDIIHGVYVAARRILMILPPTFERTDLLSAFKSLALSVEHDNTTVLHVDVEPIVEE